MERLFEMVIMSELAHDSLIRVEENLIHSFHFSPFLFTFNFSSVRLRITCPHT